MPRYRRSVVWMRRDLRLDDHAALAWACKESDAVALAFVIDSGLLRSGRIGAPIVRFFFAALQQLRDALRSLGSDLMLLQGEPSSVLPAFVRELGADALFFNEDYEPAARQRDARTTRALERHGVRVRALVDHVYFGADEILQAGGTPYRVFTPYKRVWLDQHNLSPRRPYASAAAAASRLLPAEIIGDSDPVPQPEACGFASGATFTAAGEAQAKTLLDNFIDERIEDYAQARNAPSADATSHLSPHLRAGTVGIRTVIANASAASARARGPARTSIDTWIGELVWRDFYQMILERFPHVDGAPFQRDAESIAWENDEAQFDAWCNGRTGYPIVDAAMRQLNQTGWMHNRCRMIVASFLTKDLLVDWRWGERYFEQHLADADLAANNGGWQWAASTGTDAVPYFRIFNPVTQSKTFDPDGTFIRAMLPELAGVPAPKIHEPRAPIVDHKWARERALRVYERAFKKSSLHQK